MDNAATFIAKVLVPKRRRDIIRRARLLEVLLRAGNGTLVRVWGTAGKAEHGRFALETSK